MFWQFRLNNTLVSLKSIPVILNSSLVSLFMVSFPNNAEGSTINMLQVKMKFMLK